MRKVLSLIFFGILISFAIYFPTVNASSENSEFSIQVSPSPIVDSIKPGVEKVIDFQVRNQTNHDEFLKVELKKFDIDENNGTVKITENYPEEVRGWVKLSNPKFTVGPGKSFTQQLIIDTPESAGFNYNFVVVISREKEPNDTDATAKLKGSVAIFTLLSVDRPDAVRKLELLEFTSKRKSYEYLPATFDIKLKNSGNTIVKPYGNIYIQRQPNSSQPISVLELNQNESYILPGVSRTYTEEWNDGFPFFNKTKVSDNSDYQTNLTWNWNSADKFRFGKYYAKLVAVYNDGQRDIPIESTISFWVIPWKLIIGLVVILGVLIVGIITIIRKPVKAIRKRNKTSKEDKNKDASDKN